MNQTMVSPVETKVGLDQIELLLAEPLQQALQKIDLAVKSEYVLVNQASSYLFHAGGKRIRPMLVLLTSGLTGRITPESIELAATAEMIHTATLIHDDIVDESYLRRGKTSVNGKWGNQVAVLVGDFLYAKASTIAAHNGIQKYAQMLAEATTEMCLGEIRQIEQQGNINITESEYIEIIRRKTGILMSVCAEVGGIVNDIPEQQVAVLRQFGLQLGIVFQLIDDTLDFTANLDQLGKPTNHDFIQGKMTLPLIHLRDHLERIDRDRLVSFTDHPMNPADIEWLNQQLEEYHALDYVRK
ncbi:MAG: polyprenyl synthetase family protein, partial [bacterium]